MAGFSVETDGSGVPAGNAVTNPARSAYVAVTFVTSEPAPAASTGSSTVPPGQARGGVTRVSSNRRGASGTNNPASVSGALGPVNQPSRSTTTWPRWSVAIVRPAADTGRIAVAATA